MIRRPPRSTLFPYRRSSDLNLLALAEFPEVILETAVAHLVPDHRIIVDREEPGIVKIDRKSTRLNSSHVEISYAVFCLKKKKKNTNITSNQENSHAYTDRRL